MPNYNLDDYLAVTHKLSSAKRDIYGIPFIEKQDFPFEKIATDYTLVKYNNCVDKTKLLDRKIGYGFAYDSELIRCFTKPIKFLCRVGKCKAWVTPDSSIDMEASPAQALGIVEKTRFIGALGQEYGQTVFAAVGWSREELDDICFAGLRDGAIFFISTLGVNNNECRNNFLRGYHELRRRFPNSKIVCLSSKIDGMDDDIIHIEYEESFGYENHQQLKLINYFNKANDFGENHGK